MINMYCRRNGRWEPRAAQVRKLTNDRYQECQRFLRTWINTQSAAGHREMLNADPVVGSQV